MVYPFIFHPSSLIDKNSYFTIFKLFDLFSVQFMKSNIVGTVIIFSLLVWIPASCTVSYIVSISMNWKFQHF